MSEVPHRDVPDPRVDEHGLPEELTGQDLVPPGEGPGTPDPPEAGDTDLPEVPDIEEP